MAFTSVVHKCVWRACVVASSLCVCVGGGGGKVKNVVSASLHEATPKDACALQKVKLVRLDADCADAWRIANENPCFERNSENNPKMVCLVCQLLKSSNFLQNRADGRHTPNRPCLA